MTIAMIAALIARCGIVLLFLPFSALDKLLNFRGAVGQCSEMFRPHGLATVVLMGGLAIEVFASTGVITGIADRAAALVLAGYCAMTALLFKRFWATGDFADPAGKGRGLFWDFLKNLSLGAGFLLIVVGTDGSGLAPFLAHPLASSHPYALHTSTGTQP